MKSIEQSELLFSRNPKISVADVRTWIARQKSGDATVKGELIQFIEHRLRGRYITPLLHVVPTRFKSGFLMMASACLLIETIQTFLDGKNESRDASKGKNKCESGSENAFVCFFKRYGAYFPGLRETFPVLQKKDKHGNLMRDKLGNVVQKCTFYKHIRCGILHQAETTGRSSVVRDESPIFDSGERTVNADRFLEAVDKCLDKYVADLQKEHISSELWNSAVAKLKYICDNFEHDVT